MKRMQSWTVWGLAIVLLFTLAGTSLAKEEERGGKRTELKLEFTDAAEAEWAAAYIGKMKSKQVLSGYPDGTFQPNAPVKRVEAITAAVRLMGLEAEAKAVSTETKLNFKDASDVESWAVGYVKVALEQGLFDEMADQVQPEKPASRLWIASLLVKALGLQDEALARMNEAPTFEDATSIPAGSAGYVNVAVEEGIVSGYPDGTFQPHKNVSRAELAALLDRTNIGLLEQEGALTVSGVVEQVAFADSVTDAVYAEGTLTIRTFQGNVQSYVLAADLPVTEGNGFILADQLVTGDVVSLIVEDGFVVEASVVEDSGLELLESGIVKLEYKVEFQGGGEYKLEYKNHNGKVSGEIKGSSDTETGNKALETITLLLTEAALNPDLSTEEVVTQLQAAAQHELEGVKEIKLEVHFSNGVKLEYKAESEDEEKGRKDSDKEKREDSREEDDDDSDEDREDRDDRDDREESEEVYPGIEEFKLKFKLESGESYSIELKADDDRVVAKLESDWSVAPLDVEGKAAEEYIVGLLDDLMITSEDSEEELAGKLLTRLGLSADEMKELEVEIEFTSGKEIEID